MWRHFFLAVGLLSSTYSFAGASTVHYSHVFSSMGTNITAQLWVSYQATDLPAGSRVYLGFGFERSEFENGALVLKKDWQEIGKEQELSLTFRSDIWATDLQKVVYTRGAATRLTGFDYYIKLVLPSGEVVYDRGSSTLMGFRRVVFPLDPNVCRGEGPGASYCALKPTSVDRS